MALENIEWLDETEMRAWRGMLSAHIQLYNRLDEELIAEHGITFAEYEVLVHTSESENGIIRMSTLADAALVSRSGLTRRVQHLVQQGFIERQRCKEDKRGTFAVLTPKGWQKLKEASCTHIRGVRQHMMSKLSIEEIGQLATSLEKIVAD